MKVIALEKVKEILPQLIKSFNNPAIMIWAEMYKVCITFPIVYRVVIVDRNEIVNNGRVENVDEIEEIFNHNLEIPVYFQINSKISKPDIINIGLNWSGSSYNLSVKHIKYQEIK